MRKMMAKDKLKMEAFYLWRLGNLFTLLQFSWCSPYLSRSSNPTCNFFQAIPMIWHYGATLLHYNWQNIYLIAKTCACTINIFSCVCKLEVFVCTLFTMSMAGICGEVEADPKIIKSDLESHEQPKNNFPFSMSPTFCFYFRHCLGSVYEKIKLVV